MNTSLPSPAMSLAASWPRLSSSMITSIYSVREAALRQPEKAVHQRMAQILAAEAKYRSECQERESGAAAIRHWQS